MSFYLQILAIQRPIDLGIDPKDNRVVISCNFECVARAPVDTFEEDIAKILADAGIATLSGGSMDTFLSRAANVPTSGTGPFNHIFAYGGGYPYETQDARVVERIAVQVLIRAATYAAARARALAVWRALNGQRNVTVTP